MVPSDGRIVGGISDALQVLSTETLSESAKAALAAARIGVDELALRSDPDFFPDYGRHGVALVLEGRRMAEGRSRSGKPAVHDRDPPAAPVDRIANVDGLRAELASLVETLSSDGADDPDLRHYLARVVDWENHLYKIRAQPPSRADAALSKPAEAVTRESLQGYLARKFPEWGALQVSNVQIMRGGFSKKTVLFDVEDALQGTRSLVLRAEQPDALVFFDGAKSAQEFRVLRLAWDAGIRVAEPLWHEPDATPFGGSFLVSRRATGRNIGNAVGSTEQVSASLLRELLENLVRIHQTRIDPADENVRSSHLGYWAKFATLTASTRESVAYWQREVAKMQLPVSPLTVRALDWLARNVPNSDEAPCLVHRDYGLHNLLIQDDRVSCILDWESATVGDPAEELSWFINALGQPFDRQHIIDLYAHISGRRIPSFRIRYFDVFNALKFAVTCSLALVIFERNRSAPMDLCRLGFSYMHHGTSKLNECIEKANAEK